ncbi:MAG: CHAT domain-containing protein [Leptolyngbyaceae cyanobacterium bins.349]|nr:CHAT domain-containing protein [Leptolyngbyaceae cyanobacterium bins.349]
MACCLCWFTHVALAAPPPTVAPTFPLLADLPIETALERGQSLYEAGQYAEAVTLLEQAVSQVAATGQVAVEVSALRNLALVYGRLGNWAAANQAIATSQTLLDRLPAKDHRALQAAVLDVQGSLQLEQGQARAAIATWEAAAKLYGELGDQEKSLRNQINQAQALQRLGFYRRSIELLTPIVQTLASQPDSLTKTVSLRTLGDGLQVVGDVDESEKVLEQSLALAKRLNSTNAIAQAELSLGNTLQLQGKRDVALAAYQRAEAASTSALTRVQAQLNQLKVFTATRQITEVQSRWQLIQATLETLPLNQSSIVARINLAQTLIQLNQTQNPTPNDIAQILTHAIQHARSLQDQRNEATAIGTLGTLYERTGQLADAQKLSNQALALAQTNNANDIAYRWQWQLGRIHKAKGDAAANPADYQRAIAAYTDALSTLQLLRADLVTVNTQAQVSFQESVEPIHREFVSLLLDSKRGEVTAQSLESARQVIESLQLAELDNFFREACLRATPTAVDQIDQQAAVIYPIILSDRLEVIVSLPQQPLRHYSTRISRTEFEAAAAQLRQYLVLRIGRLHLRGMQNLYDWIIRPVEADLVASRTQTIVFVLDGVLRNLPMSALYDGNQFLIEKYSIALTPGLQLLNPRPLQAGTLNVLTAGLSESRQGFSALPNVVSEVKQIQATVPSQVFLNQDFTEDSFKQALSSQTAPIVHLATHGKFSSDKDQTFVLTWDERLGITTLNNLLQLSELNRAVPIELLVLSACETATGDKQAALGMAGMAVRAGARSTIASLWQINDESTSLLMSRFYQELAKSKTTKAEALRQAQLAVLQEPRFRQHPYFWAPYVLVGNWL